MAITHYIKLLRPHQWVKNLFCFLPLFFGRHITNWEHVLPCIITFVAFCLASSFIYCINDIFDVEVDRKHPLKSIRPIANGTIPIWGGYLIGFICLTLSFIVIFFTTNRIELLSVILLYVVMNIAYCTKLKHIAIIDVLIISTGFVLRVFAGGFTSGVELSHWIILITFLLSLFLALAKRRDDVITYENTGIALRKNIHNYNRDFMNQAISIVASITIVCYIMYTVSDNVIERIGSPYLYITTIFVLAGIFRFLQVTIVNEKSYSPTQILLNDRFIQSCIAGWILTFTLILYV